jgi:hypothetical protein
VAALGERAAWRLHRHTFWPGLGVFPGTNLVPHWDAVDAYIPGLAEVLVTNLGPPFRLVAVDERTAMLGDGGRWSVLGEGGVHFLEEGGWTDHWPGTSFDLDLAREPTHR